MASTGDGSFWQSGMINPPQHAPTDGLHSPTLLAAVAILFALAAVAYALLLPSSALPLPSHLRIGLLPAENPEVLKTQYEPLLHYLEGELGLPLVAVYPDSYDDLFDRFASGNLAVAHLGGYLYTRAHLEHNAEPLVMRTEDANYTSYFLVRADSRVMSVEQLNGRSFAFGATLSASGHLMPRYYLRTEKAIHPESHFGPIRYASRHDLTVELVANGTVTGGVVSADVVARMVEQGRVDPATLRVIWRTPTFADNPWAVRHDLNAELKLKLRDAFLKLAMDRPADREVLKRAGTAGFLPAALSDFRALKQSVLAFNMRHRSERAP